MEGTPASSAKDDGPSPTPLFNGGSKGQNFFPHRSSARVRECEAGRGAGEQRLPFLGGGSAPRPGVCTILVHLYISTYSEGLGSLSGLLCEKRGNDSQPPQALF
jgi:hypothetical protein